MHLFSLLQSPPIRGGVCFVLPQIPKGVLNNWFHVELVKTYSQNNRRIFDRLRRRPIVMGDNGKAREVESVDDRQRHIDAKDYS